MQNQNENIAKINFQFKVMKLYYMIKNNLKFDFDNKKMSHTNIAHNKSKFQQKQKFIQTL